MDVRQAPNLAGGKSFLVTWAEDFIFAGSSALLLLIANLFPAYWYFSFFALTPFLYRIIKATPNESLRLGILFGLSFFGVSEFGAMGSVGAIHVEHPAIGGESPLLRLVFGTGLFAFFGWAVCRARQRWGFYPSIIALLWVGLEIGVVKLGFINGLLGQAEFSHPFFGGLVGLFGFLTVSAIIILLNSLLVLLIVKTLKVTKPRGKTIHEKKRIWDFSSTPGLSGPKYYLVPEDRAPPCIVATSLSQK
jgi:apolipoprotein N-acyltransferase